MVQRRDMDVTSASARSVETDSEWPVIIQCKSDMPVGYIEVDVLGFEDWLRCMGEVEVARGIENWKRMKDEDPARWLNRMRFANRIAETALTKYRELA